MTVPMGPPRRPIERNAPAATHSTPADGGPRHGPAPAGRAPDRTRIPGTAAPPPPRRVIAKGAAPTRARHTAPPTTPDPAPRRATTKRPVPTPTRARHTAPPTTPDRAPREATTEPHPDGARPAAPGPVPCHPAATPLPVPALERP
ncbi:hypothetical protein GCM10022380_73030 [Amycolatopsis tucumanensis]|uniref:Uncharacterized protein n=1 Tax=Amycolatopsis tucumanensis TaxID=401106 RepID=A0ABP7JHD6_9PSEU